MEFPSFQEMIGRVIYILIILSFSFNAGNAQIVDTSCPTGLETSIWYMGTHSIHWRSGKPEVDSGFTLRPGEAQTSICDRDGRLLFYTDNNYIFNARHSMMKNGALSGGGRSSTMNVILPYPDSANLYYLIYPDQVTDQSDTFPNKLRYALINMELDGGLGDVVFKDRILMDSSSERVEGIRHCNGKDWWILAQNSITDDFVVWKLDSSGIHKASFNVYKSGKRHNIDYKYALRGYLKASPNGQYISETTIGKDLVNNKFIYGYEIHRFDPSTGRIYDGIDVGLNIDEEELYSSEFSPDHSKVYLCGYRIWQLDISRFDSTLISASKKFVARPTGNLGAMSLAPDGKIYFTRFSNRYKFLHIIEKPNLTFPLCEFRESEFFLGGATGLGSPHFAQGLMWPDRAYIQGPEAVCLEDSLSSFLLLDPCPHEQVSWSLLDGGRLIFSSNDSLVVRFTSKGYHRVSVSYSSPCGLKTDTLIVKVRDCNCIPALEWLSLDTMICQSSEANLRFTTEADSIFMNGRELVAQDTIELKGINKDSCITVSLKFDVFCDTTIFICVTTYPESPVVVDQIWICPGDSLLIENNWVKDSITIENININQYGCDSVSLIQIGLKELPRSSNENIKLCAGDSIWVYQSWIKTDTVINLKFTSHNGCDSIHQVKIEIYPEIPVTQHNHSLCYGDSIFIKQMWIKSTSGFISIYPSITGCDSIVVDSIIRLPEVIHTESEVEICPGDSIFILDRWIYDSTVIRLRLINTNFCDSFHTIKVKLRESPPVQEFNYKLCYGDSILIQDIVYKQAARIKILRPNQEESCDSIFFYIVEIYDSIELVLPSIIEVEENLDFKIRPDYRSDIAKFQWSPELDLSCYDCPEPVFNSDQSRSYTLTVTDRNGCVKSAEVSIIVKSNRLYMYFPNVFSPNDDLYNDEWQIFQHPLITIQKTEIFDRRGSKIFESEGDAWWNGKFRGQQWLPGVYAYLVRWTDDKGKTNISRGNLTLIR